MTILETRLQDWPDEAACAATAARLALRPALRRAFITLQGPLGAGKTAFARHLLQALGVTGRIKSPTYAVVEEYAVSCPMAGRTLHAPTDPATDPDPEHPHGAGSADLAIWHFDFYRFDDPQEFEDAGFRELFASPGLKLAEWPEKAGALLPQPDLSLHLTTPPEGDGDRRSVRFDAHTALGRELLP